MRRAFLSGLLAAVLGLTVAACSAETGDDASSSDSNLDANKPHILTVGDSITFAWDPRIEKDNKKVVASNYKGFADLLGQRLGAVVDNSACPGEASGSFLDPKAEDNGCRKNHVDYRMHTEWMGAPDQIEFVKAYLTDAIAQNKAPKLVTITLGGNDLLLIKHHCKLPGLLASACQLGRLPFAVHAYGDHVQSILEDIDATGYKGTVVFMTTYAPDYSDHVATIALKSFNDELKEHAGKAQANAKNITIKIADAYASFEQAANAKGGKTCETGLLIPNGDGTCDIHPTAAGHALIAKTILDAADL